MLAQTMTSVIAVDSSASLTQVVAAVASVLLLIIAVATPLIISWARSVATTKAAEAATAAAEAETRALKAQAELALARADAEKAKTLNLALVKQTEALIDKTSPDDDSKRRTKGEFQAAAAAVGVADTLKAAVEGAGLSSKAPPPAA